MRKSRSGGAGWVLGLLGLATGLVACEAILGTGSLTEQAPDAASPRTDAGACNGLICFDATAPKDGTGPAVDGGSVCIAGQQHCGSNNEPQTCADGGWVDNGPVCVTTCSHGACVVVDDTLVTGQNSPSSIAVDSTSVYWTNSAQGITDAGAVMKVAIDGGLPVTLASGQTSPTSIAVEGSNVYWLVPLAVMKVGINGGTPTTLVSGGGYNSFTVDSTTVYWTVAYTDGSGNTVGQVMKAGLDGGTPTTLATGQIFPYAIAVNGNKIYWANLGTTGSCNAGCPGSIVTVPIDGGTVATLASPTNHPRAISVDGTNVYWTNFLLPGLVVRVSILGGKPSTLAQAPAAFATQAIALDTANVYWTQSENSGSLMKTPLDGGVSVTLANLSGAGSGVAVNSTGVFVAVAAQTALDGGTIARIRPK
jgi:hypothetical protein